MDLNVTTRITSFLFHKLVILNETNVVLVFNASPIILAPSGPISLSYIVSMLYISWWIRFILFHEPDPVQSEFYCMPMLHLTFLFLLPQSSSLIILFSSSPNLKKERSSVYSSLSLPPPRSSFVNVELFLNPSLIILAPSGPKLFPIHSFLLLLLLSLILRRKRKRGKRF